MTATPNDLKTIGILLGLGAITPRQASRLEAAVERGLSLEEGFRTLPLIEPIDLLRARRLLGPSSEDAPDVPPPSPSPTSRASHPPLRRDADGIPVLEWEEPAGMPEYTPPERRLKPVNIQPTGQQKAGALPHPPQAMTEDVIFSPDRPEAPGEHPRLDLEVDEGIPLVREVHSLFREVLNSGLRGFQLVATSDFGAIANYALSGRRLACRPMEQATVERMAGHLKVAARLSPWKTEQQEGWFLIERRGNAIMAHMKSESRDGLSRLTISVFPG